MRTALALLPGLVVLLLAAGCGRGPDAPALPAGVEPPVWSLARVDRAPEGVSVDLKAGSACRALLLVDEGDGQPRVAAQRDLAAGEAVRLWWKGEGQRAQGAASPVSVEDQRDGRTEGWAVRLAFGFEDDAVRERRPIVATRPGRGRALPAFDALPPVAPGALPFDRDVELCAVAVVDGGPIDLTLTGGAGGARVKGSLDGAQGERAVLLRLRLRFEPRER